MNKDRVTISLDPELRKEAEKFLREQDRKLSTVLNSLLRKYLNKEMKNARAS